MEIGVKPCSLNCGSSADSAMTSWNGAMISSIGFVGLRALGLVFAKAHEVMARPANDAAENP